MSEAATEFTQEESPEETQAESISLNDLASLMQIVELASTRGAFRAAEMSTVGALFDRLNGFLSAVQAQQQAAAEESAEEE